MSVNKSRTQSDQRTYSADLSTAATWFDLLGFLYLGLTVVVVVASGLWILLTAQVQGRIRTLDVVVTVVICSLFVVISLTGRYTCLLISRAIPMGLDIEKNTRATSEAAVYLARLSQKQEAH